jgi:alpha-mannosidase
MGLHMKEYHVLSHTHWDREWYQPFEEFRLRLVDLLDNLLEIFEREPDYIFHLDAQAIALEDYLEIRPHQRARLEELVREKRLLVGPWSVQNDFYLTSGEATIRNLIIGSQIAEAFGCCSKTGYVPDQFGLIGQLPQLFNGFGIEGCIFGRGYNLFKLNKKGERIPVPTPNEFEWQSPDGSSVLTVLMRNWYNNAQRFSEEPAKSARFLELIDEALEGTSSTPYRLLMNGVDHLEAQENLLPILKTLDESLEGGTIFQSTMPDYLKKVRAHLKGREVHAVKGELREGVNEQILQGTLSSRPYLKTSNARAQALLELQLEPLWSMLGLMTNARYPQDELRYAWKMLMKNHPHDSICGCSRDEVHRDNEQRFKRVFEMGNDLLRRGGAQLSSRIDRSKLKGAPYFVAVANTLPTPRSETVTARVFLPCEDGIENFELRDDRGRAVEFDVLENRRRNRTTITAVNLPGQIACRELVIRFFAEQIPACGYRVFAVEPLKSLKPLKALKSLKPVKTVVLENEFLKVTVNAKGKVALLDKQTGIKTADLLTLTDEADFGHSYNFMAAKGDQPEIISDTVPSIRLLEKTGIGQAVELEWKPKLPAEYDRKRDRRSGRRVANRITLKLSLSQGGRRLDLDAQVDNRSKDHRLRLWVNTDVASDFSFASAPFEVVKRDRRDLLKGIRDDGTQPNGGMVSATDKERSLAVLNEGVYE